MTSLGRKRAGELALLAMTFAAVTCGGSEHSEPAPWPDAVVVPSSPSRPPAAPVEPWDLDAALAESALVLPRAASQHGGGGLEGEVLANSAARNYAKLAVGAALPVGSTLLERQFEGSATSRAAVFAMVKRAEGYDRDGGDWEYFVFGGDGALQLRGRLVLCARCHADGPHDHLFGAGRP